MTTSVAHYVSALEGAVPGGRAREVPERTLGGTIARAELYGETVMYAYLDYQGSTRLRIFPGDTLGQARVLYGEPERVTHVLTLDGWDVAPNFHLGYRQPGLCWLDSNWDAQRYVDYWMAEIGDARELPTAEAKRELEKLVDIGMFDARVLDQFDRELGRRPRAAPRPGTRLTRRVADGASVGALADQVRTSLGAALVALGEPVDALSGR